MPFLNYNLTFDFYYCATPSVSLCIMSLMSAAALTGGRHTDWKLTLRKLCTIDRLPNKKNLSLLHARLWLGELVRMMLRPVNQERHRVLNRIVLNSLLNTVSLFSCISSLLSNKLEAGFSAR